MTVSRTHHRHSVTGARIAADGRVVSTAHNRRGAIVVLVGILLVSMVGLFALAVDFGRLDSLKADLQTSADAAALAGAAEMIKVDSAPFFSSNPRTVANAWVTKNSAMSATVTPVSEVCGTYTDVGPTFFVTSSPGPKCEGDNAIQVTVSGQSSGLFMAIFGVSPPLLSATAIAAVSPEIAAATPYPTCRPLLECRVYLVVEH